MNKKREQWRLPKTFKVDPVVDGLQQRHDGEPRFFELVKHLDDTTLSAFEHIKCCNCGLKHLHTYNVFKAPSGRWFLVVRPYRI